MTTLNIENNLDKVILGLNKTADIVKSTMGAEGKNVAVVDNYERIKYTQDGVTVAKSIKLEDPIENVGAQAIISAANKTVKECGDGTTLTTLLTQKLIISMLNDIKENNPNKVIKTYSDQIDQVIKNITSQRRKIRSIKDINKINDIATVASKSKEIGELISSIYLETGLNSLIKVEKSNELDFTTCEITKGLQYDTGFVHTGFITNTETEECIFNNARVYITEKDITTISEELQQLLDDSSEIPVLVIANNYSDYVKRTCVLNVKNANKKICLVKFPGWGHQRPRNTEDINAFINSDTTVNKVVVTPFTFTLFNDSSDKLVKRIQQLEKLKDSTIEKIDEEDYFNRIHKLQGSSAIIYVGADTELNRDEEFDRIEDAVGAVKTAINYGYVEGAGYTLYLESLKDCYTDVFKPILTAPYYQILKNANIDITNDRINVKTKQQVKDFYKEGIIDPANSIIQAFKNSFATSKLLINTSFILYNEYPRVQQ
jgi:chaperonin GroEL